MKSKTTLRFTDPKVTSLPNSSERYELIDTVESALALRVGANSKVWVASTTFNGKRQRITIGRYPAIGVEQARAETRRYVALARSGQSPRAYQERKRAEARTEASQTTEAVLERWLVEHAERNRKNDRAPRLLMNKHLPKPWRRRTLASIEGVEIDRWLRDVARDTPGSAFYVHATFRTIMNWAVAERIIDYSPFRHTKFKPKPPMRTRVLSIQEMASVYNAARSMGGMAGQIHQLIALTTARRSEVGDMRWEHIDLNRSLWTIPATKYKSGHEHNLPLNPQAMHILEDVGFKTEGRVFPPARKGAVHGWAAHKKKLTRLLAKAGTPVRDWTFHDFRAGVSSWLVDEGDFDPHVASAILGHVIARGSDRHYQFAKLDKKKRVALEAWGRALIRAAGPDLRVVNA